MAGNKKVKTPIVYYGGKTSMLSHILPLIPYHEVYTEVFFGGGAVYFSKPKAKNETINDKLNVVINFYRCLKFHYAELLPWIHSTLISREIHKEALSIIKRFRNSKKLNVKAAWAFWVCTNFAYSNKLGGGYKYSNDMSVSVPETLAKRKSQFNEQLVKRIELTYIENDDAIKILRSRNVAKAFHYIDPPYFNADQGHYAGYTEEDFINLLDFLSKECVGRFLLSNYRSETLDKYVKENNWKYKEVTVRIKAPSKEVRDKTEVLVWNYNLQQDLFTQPIQN